MGLLTKRRACGSVNKAKEVISLLTRPKDVVRLLTRRRRHGSVNKEKDVKGLLTRRKTSWVC